MCFGVQPVVAGLTPMLASSPPWKAGQAREVAGSVDCWGSEGVTWGDQIQME